MKHYLPVLTALAMSLMSSTFTPSLKAGDLDKKTVITISQPVAVEGTILPAGKYVLMLEEEPSSRDIVTIFNGEGRADDHGDGHSRIPATANRQKRVQVL